MKLSKLWLERYDKFLQNPANEEKMEELINLLQEISSFAELEKIYKRLNSKSRLGVETKKRMEQIIAALNLYHNLPTWFMRGMEKRSYFSLWQSSKDKISELIVMIIEKVFSSAIMDGKETGFFEVSFVDMHTQYGVLCVEPVFGFVRTEEETSIHKEIRKLLHLIPLILYPAIQQKYISGWFGNYYIEGKISSTDNLNYLLVYQNLEFLISKKEAELAVVQERLTHLKQIIKTAKEKRGK